MENLSALAFLCEASKEVDHGDEHGHGSKDAKKTKPGQLQCHVCDGWSPQDKLVRCQGKQPNGQVCMRGYCKKCFDTHSWNWKDTNSPDWRCSHCQKTCPNPKCGFTVKKLTNKRGKPETATAVNPSKKVKVEDFSDKNKQKKTGDGKVCTKCKTTESGGVWKKSPISDATLCFPCFRRVEKGSDKDKKKKINEDLVASVNSKVAAVQASQNKIVAAADAKPVQPEDNWVQCDRCEKWRKIPGHVDMDSLPDVWYCSMNRFDPSRASCKAPEEEYNQQAEEEAIAEVLGPVVAADEPPPVKEPPKLVGGCARFTYYERKSSPKESKEPFIVVHMDVEEGCPDVGGVHEEDMSSYIQGVYKKSFVKGGLCAAVQDICSLLQSGKGDVPVRYDVVGEPEGVSLLEVFLHSPVPMRIIDQYLSLAQELQPNLEDTMTELFSLMMEGDKEFHRKVVKLANSVVCQLAVFPDCARLMLHELVRNALRDMMIKMPEAEFDIKGHAAGTQLAALIQKSHSTLSHKSASSISLKEARDDVNNLQAVVDACNRAKQLCTEWYTTPAWIAKLKKTVTDAVVAMQTEQAKSLKAANNDSSIATEMAGGNESDKDDSKKNKKAAGLISKSQGAMTKHTQMHGAMTDLQDFIEIVYSSLESVMKERFDSDRVRDDMLPAFGIFLEAMEAIVDINSSRLKLVKARSEYASKSLGGVLESLKRNNLGHLITVTNPKYLELASTECNEELKNLRKDIEDHAVMFRYYFDAMSHVFDKLGQPDWEDYRTRATALHSLLKQKESEYKNATTTNNKKTTPIKQAPAKSSNSRPSTPVGSKTGGVVKIHSPTAMKPSPSPSPPSNGHPTPKATKSK